MSIFRYNALSSANSLILEVRLFSMSLMYRRNRSGPSTVPWGTPDVYICVSKWEPFTSTWRVLFVRKAFIQLRVWCLIP